MKRRKAREVALAFLYQMEIRDEMNNFSEETVGSFIKEQGIEDEDIKGFAATLINGVVKNLPIIDKKISEYSINWSLNRISYIDRNILRIGIYELLFLDSIPSVVSINEAIELAKRYSTKDSPRFVNGILHSIKEAVVKSQDVSKNEEKSS